MKVEEFAVLTQSLESMGEARGNEQASGIVCGQDFGMPMKKRIGVRSKIDSNIVNFAPKTAHQLVLSVWRVLKVHPPHRTFALGQCVIHLRDADVETGIPEFLNTEETTEETPLVKSFQSFDHENTSKWGRNKIEAVHVLKDERPSDAGQSGPDKCSACQPRHAMLCAIPASCPVH